jgi:DNA-binding transcriptional MerR regulator
VEEPWTILELAELAADALAVPAPAGSGAGASGAGASGAGPSGSGAPGAGPSGAEAPGAARSGPARTNGRVRDVPNERLVRWYVTVGLVDPPLSRRGRVARYGRRHLLQLVAVKRRQAEGRSLAEIQAELAGATDETLAAVARVPDSLPAPAAPVAAPGRFWARPSGQAGSAPADRPAPSASAAAEGAGRPLAAAHGEPADNGAIPPGGLVHGVRLAAGVTLLLEGTGREPGPEDVTEILNAAQPLLAELARRRLYADHLEGTR